MTVSSPVSLLDLMLVGVLGVGFGGKARAEYLGKGPWRVKEALGLFVRVSVVLLVPCEEDVV